MGLVDRRWRSSAWGRAIAINGGSSARSGRPNWHGRPRPPRRNGPRASSTSTGWPWPNANGLPITSTAVDRLLEDCPPGLRGWEWRYLKRQCHHDLLSLYHSRPSPQSRTVTCIRFGADGRTFATASKDGTIRLWDAASGRELRLFGRSKHATFSLDYEPGGRRLAAGGEDGEIQIWDIATGSLETDPPPRHRDDLRTAVQPGRSVAGLRPRISPLGIRGPHAGQGRGPALGPDERQARPDAPRPFSERHELAFSPDGHTLASVSGSWLTVPQAASRPGELILWNPDDGELVRSSPATAARSQASPTAPTAA